MIEDKVKKNNINLTIVLILLCGLLFGTLFICALIKPYTRTEINANIVVQLENDSVINYTEVYKYRIWNNGITLWNTSGKYKIMKYKKLEIEEKDIE